MHFQIANIKNFTTEKIELLCKLINDIYHVNEDNLIDKSNPRTSLNDLKAVIEKKQLIIAEKNEKIIGCIQLSQVDSKTGIFAMLVADPEHRQIGLGKKLIENAELYAKELGFTTMQLKLLSPKNWIHEQKEFLRKWYERIGYIRQYDVPFENEKFYVTPCNFTLYCKKLN